MRMRIAKTHSQDATRGAFLITELGDRIGLARALSEATAPPCSTPTPGRRPPEATAKAATVPTPAMDGYPGRWMWR
jgi:hypothetical protein